jgi:hypothetical protein
MVVMGREVRRVPATWQHPKDQHGSYIPLYPGNQFAQTIIHWREGDAMWSLGFKKSYSTDGSGWELHGEVGPYSEWDGECPDPAEYMPAWPDEFCTHMMMYEDTSEGTPLSPAFETPEELARWLADNGASAFGNDTASYEAWLRVCRGGWAPSMVIAGGRIMSGVEAMK